MLTCKEASYLASKKLDKKLTWRESLNFRLHILMCDLCRRYAMEIKKLHSMMHKAGKSSLSMLPESVKLSKQSRKRIKQTLDKVLNQTE
jgi:predicted anti-sigma-YlaC factor YlaD